MALGRAFEEIPWSGFVNRAGGGSSTDVGVFNFWNVLVDCHDLGYDKRPSNNFFIKNDMVPGEPYSPAEDEGGDIVFLILVHCEPSVLGLKN